jgi:hypothetical protein
VVWSAEFVDQTIGDNVVGTLLGHEADAPIAGIAAGVAFALVSGLGGTFTACNVAVFGALAPLIGEPRSARARMLQGLKPLGWLTAGLLTVSASYGAIVALIGTSMPQFQTAQAATSLSPRTIQAMIVFGIIGLILICLGLSALGLIGDPLAPVSRRFPAAPMVLMGALIGGFLIGRPFPLFRQMFRDAAESHNVLYGAVAFSLQSIGNIVIVAALFLLLTLAGGARLQRWFAAKPSRLSTLIAVSFLVAGIFTLLYWDVRILARREIIWYPVVPWA